MGSTKCAPQRSQFEPILEQPGAARSWSRSGIARSAPFKAVSSSRLYAASNRTWCRLPRWLRAARPVTGRCLEHPGYGCLAFVGGRVDRQAHLPTNLPNSLLRVRPRTLDNSVARLQHRGDESRYFRAVDVERRKLAALIRVAHQRGNVGCLTRPTRALMKSSVPWQAEALRLRQLFAIRLIRLTAPNTLRTVCHAVS